MVERKSKEDEGEHMKVVVPPVDTDLQPPADRVAIQRDAQE
jgi:hypothetical protein